MKLAELNKIQSEYAELAARYRELYDFAPIGYLTLSSADRIVEANLAAAALLGIARRDLIGRWLPDMLTPESAASYHVFMTRLQESGLRQTCELCLMRSDNSAKYVQAEAAVDRPKSEVQEVRIAIIDISERMALDRINQERAHQVFSNFANVFDDGPLGIAFVSLDGKIIHANGQFSTMLGYTLGELMSMHLVDSPHSNEVLATSESAPDQAEVNPAAVTHETRYRRKDGGVFWARTLVTLMRDSNSQPTYFMKIIEDITEQKGADQNRLNAIVEERTRIAQEIHDTLAQGFTGILIQLQAAELAPEQSQSRVHINHAIQLARESIQEARRTVHALRPQALESNNLPTALSQLVEQASTINSMEIEFAVDGAPFFLPGYLEDQLYRIGQEALTNAIKYSQAEKILLCLWFEAAQVKLCITDNGKGFDTGGSIHSSGFGLIGISERTTRLGGVMELASSPGHGTSITICVPAVDASLSIDKYIQ